MPDDPSPLHTDPTISTKSWIDDPLIWSDVYAKKPVEYLEMVAKGEVPKWDVDSKKWVSTKEDSETISARKIEANIAPEDPQEYEEANDDLPF